MTAPTTTAAAAATPAPFIDRDGGPAVPGACDALPPLLNPLMLIALPYIVEGVCRFHVAVPVHMRADVVKGRRGDAANDGLGHCPLTACGLRIRPHHMYGPMTTCYGGSGTGPALVKRGKIADVTCLTCRRVAAAIRREASPLMRDGLAWADTARSAAMENATIESFTVKGEHAA